MKKLICTFLFNGLTVQFSAAAEAAAGSNPPADATAGSTTAATEGDVPAPTPPPALELKSKSSFVLQENARNPFWPIGWRPAAKQASATTSTEPSGAEILPNAFVVSSIVLDPRAKFAIINGKAMTEGQVFGLQMGSSTYQMTVKAIEDGQVTLVRGRDQVIIVPLRRR